ncbi:MAG: hypothetical protein H6766_06540 [Candidatus Peribacteria bacterium]|nr:MAG: hypothetical protein H6766_06540 [Candidatus Peribacteria bacterium]
MKSVQLLLKKYWIPAVVLLLLGVVGYALIGGKGTDSSLTEVGSGPSISGNVIAIDTIPLVDLVHQVTVSKSSQLTSASTITISAQAAGRVNTIWVEPGTDVTQGRQLISLSDTTNSYAIALQRASVGVEGAKLQYEQSELQLQNSIANAVTNFNQAQQSYNTLKTQYDQQLAQALLTVQSTVASTDVTLDTLESQLFSLKSSIQSLTIILKDHIDRVTGNSAHYSSKASSYEDALTDNGTQNQYNTAKGDFTTLDNEVDILDEMEVENLTGQELINTVNELYTITTIQNKILLNLQDLYQRAIPDDLFLGQTQSAYGFTSALKAQLQGEVTTMLSQNQ